MTKLKTDAITDSDLADFVASDSDFAFEMQVVTRLRNLRCECSHSGTYQDPVSDKIRQFDIRAVKYKDTFSLALAVECKNLRPNYPLLLSAVPRTAVEAFHDLIVFDAGMVVSASKVIPVEGDLSAYKPGEMVGKKTGQVGRDTQGNFVSEDGATFEKLNQAVNSCLDLVRWSTFNGSQPYIRAVVPVLVVPTNLLWQVDYSADGTVLVPPRRVARASLSLHHTWTVDRDKMYGPIRYRLSHIEVVTLDGLPVVVDGLVGRFFSTLQPGR